MTSRSAVRSRSATSASRWAPRSSTTSITGPNALKIGVSHVRPHLPDLLAFVAETGFPAEEVTTLLADWDDAPAAYRAHTTKLVLHRAPLGVSA
ncbi:hypothetical protein [Nocardia sp. NPDC050718]|uniref:hypothetical protein n=1 Tax=Nocardia sp. NPDC050718 TaxID=3155788 RepID=UPI0033E5C19E